MPQNFHNLDLYNDAQALAKKVYQEFATKQMPLRLKEQLLSAVTSIFAQLAEMAAFESAAQQKQKLIQIIGECNETEAFLEYFMSIGIIEPGKANEFINEIKIIRMKTYRLKEAIRANG